MLNWVSGVPTAVAEALHGAMMGLQEPGVLDRIGAAAIGFFVLGCWLFGRSSRRAG